MAQFDRFLIRPQTGSFQTDLKPLNLSFGILNEYTKRGIMKYKKRSDIIDLLGQKFGDLTVIAYVEPGKYRGSRWLCKCVCGNETIAPGGHLRAGYRKSCGCRSEARIFETGIKRVYGSYKTKALRRKKEFTISLEDFGNLILQNCFYCNRSPENILKRLKTKKLQIIYNGIDRYDPDKGYIKENCVPCCYYCNHAKADLTFEQWKSHLEQIFKYQGITK